MKKFLSFLLFALCVTTAANAQFLAFDFENGNILTTVFTNDETYPWIVIDTTDDDGNAVRCIMSGNKGVASSTSAIETTVGFAADGHIAFDALCMGEGTGTAWDRCIFYIDGEAQFTYGAHIAGWNHYAYNVSAGSHTFKWVYMKDSSVNPTGDAFFVDNISFGFGTLITEINIIGFTEPAWGEHPDYEVSVPADANYTLDYVDWNWDDGDNMGILNESGTFNNEDYVYYMYFLVLPNEGCSFADDVTFMVNGETGSIENSGLSSSGSGSYWAYTINYSVIEPTTPDIQSLANWYGYALYDDLSTEHFITFSMQDINTVNAATSSTVDEYIYAACYANSYVWCITDGSKLLKASVDNTNHTIGNFETVASNFVSETAISMSYNPVDGKIYAITADYLISFDPSDPVGTLSNEIPLNISPQTLAINSEGEAYCITYETGMLYQLDLNDGSATQIGNTGQNVAYVQDMAFDMNTGELFWAQLYSTNDYGMYKVDPATAATTYLGQVANGDVMEITGLFMVYDEQPEACMSPAPLNATPAATTATVSWTERGEATQWVVAYKADGETDFTEVTANETNYTLTGLTPGTHYTVNVRPVCEDGSLKWNSVYFTTHGLCDAPSGLEASNITGNTATLEWTGYQVNYNVRYAKKPAIVDTLFFEDFENGLPSTWTTIDNDGDGYNWIYFNNAGAEFHMYAHSGDGLVYSESYYKDYGPLTPDNWLITPQINLNGTMRVWLRGQDPDYASEHFAIYLSTTNNSVDDFTITLVPEAVATGEYVEYTADLSAYAGQRGYIAIRHFNTYDMYRLNVDDFGVFLEPWTTVTSTGNPTTLTGLDPETTYQVQVQGICEDGVTAWSEPVEFTTEPAPACVIDTIEITGFTEPVYGATPDFDVEVPADADYTLDNVTWMENYSHEMSTTETFEAKMYYMVFDIVPNEGCTFADEVTVTINGDASLVDTYWCEFLSNGDYRVITIEYDLSAPPTCEAPTNLTATNITGFDATLGWTDNNNADVWYVDIDEYGDGEWAWADYASGNVYSNSFSFHDYFDLTPGKTYRYRVQSICSDENRSDFSEFYLFTTTEETEEPCEAPTNLTATNITANSATVGWTGNSTEYNVHYRVPGVETDTVFFEDFEDADNFVDGLPNGWTSIDHDGDGYNWIYRNNYGLSSIITSHSGVGVMYSQSYDFDAGALTPDNWLITPQIELGNIVKVWLTAQDPSYPDEHFAIYLSTTGNDVTDFTVTLLPKTKATGEYVEYTADLSAYAGQQGYIAIRHFNVTDEFYLNVDDFGVYNEELWTTITATGNTAELTDLAPETTYEVQVQGICEDGVTAWTELVEFTTEAEPTCVINEVNVIGYEPPVAGENSQDHMNITVQDNNANYFLVEEMFSPEWWDEDADEYFNGTFVGGTHYSIGVKIHANDGCVFANNCTFLFDGDENLVNPEYTGVDYEDNTIAYIWTMPELATGTTSPCETPTGLTASNITATTAKLEWTGSQDQYTVRYKEDAASDWTEATTTNRFFPLTGLTPATTYTAQVQGDCGTGAKVVTDWSEPVTFTTLSGTVEPGECGPAVDCEGTSYPTVKIGDVCWMAKNLAAETCVTTGNVYAYVNDQFPDEDANVETYGLLYDEEAAFATGLCPEGYTLPTTEQFEYLKNNFTVEELRNITGWVVNTGTNGTGFSWDGSGFRNGTSETFEHLLMEGYLWAVDMTSGTPQPAMYKMMYYCNEIVRVYDFNGISASIRCVKNAEPQPEPQPEPETFRCGIDELIISESQNHYQTVQIGTQCWTKTNLRETKDKNGNTFRMGIPTVVVTELGPSLSYDYDSDESMVYIPDEENWYYFSGADYDYDATVIGYYYNWEAAQVACPDGWHLPSQEEWNTLVNYVSSQESYVCGENNSISKALSSEVAKYWPSNSIECAPGNNPSANNATGFSGVPAGFIQSEFSFVTMLTAFWSTTNYNNDKSWAFSFGNGLNLNSGPVYKYIGNSVRCLRDAEE
ncbi:MAG: choice-of-anchor J domain-containing protein [Bacteroidales bacterium]|nr:choice-of-anchor J domain-containing protein [Bacteroidales bacterium]